MHTNEEKLTLSNLGNGAAVELFGIELRRVLKDVMDPNTDPKAVREITLKVAFKPGEDRELVPMGLKAQSKLAGSRIFMSKVIIGRNQGRVEAREFRSGQRELFDGEDNVIPIENGGAE